MQTNGQAQQWAAVLDIIEEGVLTIDRQLRVTHMNRAAEEMFGCLRAEAKGRPCQEIVMMGSSLIDRLQEGIRENSAQVVFDATIKNRDRLLPVKVTALELGDLESAAIRTALVFHSASRETEVTHLKEKFLSIVSHEFRTPLTAVLGFTNILLKGIDGDLSEKQQHHLRIINSNGKRLIEMVNSLLTLSRLEGGLLTPAPVPTVLASCVDAALGSVNSETNGRGASVLRALPADLPLAMVDPMILQQVLRCLLSNALKFTPSYGQVVVSASVVEALWSGPQTNESSAAEIVVSISDTGVGISPGHLDRIWDPFYQGDSSDTRQFGGVGLGLTVAKRLVELSNGRIWVENVADEQSGATFKFSLPPACGESGTISRQQPYDAIPADANTPH